MNLVVQAGFGKGSYIDLGIADGSLKGAILSPRDEDPQSLSHLAEVLSKNSAVDLVAVDPQLYAFTVPDARIRELVDYPYNPGFLSRKAFSNINELRKLSTEALRYQRSLPVTHLISPAICLSDLRDADSQVFITMAQESISYHAENDARPLLLSIILNETALLNQEAMNEFLDIITAWHYQGVYICVQATSSVFPATLTVNALANLLYMVYVLGELNRYIVVVGFADFNALLVGSAGAQYVGSGWYNSLRQFSLSRFAPSKGGSRARPRYPSLPMLGSILVEPELAEIVARGEGGLVFNGNAFDDVLSTEPSGDKWPALQSFRAHAAAIARCGQNLSSAGSFTSRVNAAATSIERAKSVVQLLSSSGVSFQTRFGFLDTWREGLELFVDRVK